MNIFGIDAFLTLDLFNFGALIIKAILGGIYRTVARSYNMIYDFSTSIFSLTSNQKLASMVENVTDSIYTLIAVFMLFRITVTMIEYLIDPDKLNDKSSGTGKLITRIIVSLILVIGFPTVLEKVVYPLQDALLDPNDSILFKLFKVNDADAASSECINSVNSARQPGGGLTTGRYGLEELVSDCELDSDFMSAVDSKLEQYNASITCNFNNKDVSCEDYLGKNYKVKYGLYNSGSNVNNTDQKFTIYLTDDEKEAQDAKDQLDQGLSIDQVASGFAEDLDSLLNSHGGVFAMDVASSFSTKPEKVLETKFIGSASGLNDFSVLVEEEEIDYDSFLSMICGIIMIIILLILCIEVIIRNLKLVVLLVLSPIAFISYMNPNDKVLSNWFHKFIGCYLDLFIKVFAIQVAMYFISLLSTIDVKGIEKILVYLAIFIFAKTIPNLISDIFGIKDMGGTFKESMGALKNAAFAGAGAIAGGTVGLASGLGSGASIGTVAGGLLGGAFRGATGGMKSGFSGISKGVATQRKNNIEARTRNAEGGGGFWGVSTTGSKIAHMLGQQDDYEKAESENKLASDTKKGIENYEDEASKAALGLAGKMRAENDGEYAPDAFGRYAQASAKLAAFNAGTYDGPEDFNTLDGEVRKTKKAAVAEYTDMLRTGRTYSTREQERMGDDGRVYTDVVACRDYSEYFAPDDNDRANNTRRLSVVDSKMLQLTNSEQRYDEHAKDTAEGIINRTADVMEQTRAGHVSNGSN